MSQKVLNFSIKKLTLNFGEDSCEVRFPTKDELADYSEKMKSASKDDLRKMLSIVDELLIGLGAKKEILSKLTQDQTTELLEALKGN